jgi:Ti-type conjugative transfer relaxase TraA
MSEPATLAGRRLAIYSLSMSAVSRSSGRSAVAAAAYIAAEKMEDERTGLVHDYTRKGGVLHTEMMAPDDAPAWAKDRAALWNTAEFAEDKSTRRASATTARTILVALPHELTHEQRLEATRELASYLVRTHGVAVDFALHEPDREGDNRNYHAHLQMTSRRMTADGLGEKVRELDCKTIKKREIPSPAFQAVREEWERIANRALEAAGRDERIDHRSNRARGIDREATIHLGPAASALERMGEETELGNRNRAAVSANARKAEMEAELATVQAEIGDEIAARVRRQDEREEQAAVRTLDPARILETITEKRSTFSRGDLNFILAKEITDAKERAAMTTEILARPEIIGLRETAEAGVSRYTTRAVLAAERQVMKDAKALVTDTRHGLTDRVRQETLDQHSHLDREQRTAFDKATGTGGLAIIAGEAGTGKSTALAAIRDAYEANGCRVIGMAWTNAVVQDMKRDGFRDASTISSELMRLDKGYSRWNDKTVLMVDEAAMISTKHLAALTERAREAGAKVILTGDDKQLASIERGGLFGALRQEHGAAELHTVWRVSGAEQKRAFNLMHEGDFRPALEIFDRRGAINWTETQEDARTALVGKYAKDTADDPGKARFVFAYTNADVAELNRDIRAVRKERGDLGEEHLLPTKDGQEAFAVGDRIQFTGSARDRTARLDGLSNGTVGTIAAIDGQRVSVTLDGKNDAKPRVISFTAGVSPEAGEFGDFRHGYAGTIYRGQGRTLDESYLYHSQHWQAASSYVALSRHRDETAVFVARETAGDLDHLARQMGRVDDRRAM